MPSSRRTFLRASVIVAVAAFSISASTFGCKKEARCKNCGMRIDPTSPWHAELVGEDGKLIAFDTPRCALQSWRANKTQAKSIRVQDYYDRQTRDGAEVRFVVGGDVVGPMGPDIVPVDPARVAKFVQDHAADRALRLEEVTADVVANLGSK